MAAKKAKKKTKSKTAKKAVKKKVAAKKAARKTAKKKAPARKASPKKAVTAKRKAGAAKNMVRKKKQTVGEGDYEATRAFDRDQASFVKKNKAKIPALARQAKAALDGPEGASLRQAEAKARSHAAPDSETEPAPGTWVIPPG